MSNRNFTRIDKKWKFDEMTKKGGVHLNPRLQNKYHYTPTITKGEIDAMVPYYRRRFPNMSNIKLRVQIKQELMEQAIERYTEQTDRTIKKNEEIRKTCRHEIESKTITIKKAIPPYLDMYGVGRPAKTITRYYDVYYNAYGVAVLHERNYDMETFEPE